MPCLFRLSYQRGVNVFHCDLYRLRECVCVSLRVYRGPGIGVHVQHMPGSWPLLLWAYYWLFYLNLWANVFCPLFGKGTFMLSFSFFGFECV